MVLPNEQKNGQWLRKQDSLFALVCAKCPNLIKLRVVINPPYVTHRFHACSIVSGKAPFRRTPFMTLTLIAANQDLIFKQISLSEVPIAELAIESKGVIYERIVRGVVEHEAGD